MEQIITRQKTGYLVYDADGDMLDEWGHIYFSKPIALAKARALGGDYRPGPRGSVKEVIIGYQEDGQ